jgi:Nif-specific regulatory protein
MKANLDQNQVATLSTVLLTNLNESVFYSQISGFVANLFNEHKVQVFEVAHDGSTALRAENGKLIENGIEYSKGQALSGYVSRTKKAYYSNSKRDPLLATTQRDDCVESELCVPVNCDGAIIATIHVQSSNEDRKFSEEDVVIIRNILEQIESPLNNLKIYLMAKQLNKELLNQIEEKDLELQSRGPAQLKNTMNQKIEIIGHSNELTSVLKTAKRVAKEDFPIMINGRSGSGKKMLAKFIHAESNRVNAQVEVVHCSALEEIQMETEIFGTVERPGALERANGGTIIFDTVENLSENMQAKLLRTILSGEIFNAGSKVSKSVNVRIITTTKKTTEQIIEEGSLREDLLYRLNLLTINMPSLSERSDDVKVLSEHFMNNGKSTEDYKMLTERAVEKLKSYDWPGNIQELRNIMERTAILSEERYIDELDLPTSNSQEVEEVIEVVDFSEISLHELEKGHIIKTLDFLNGNKTKAAKSLGITVKTLYNKLHSYGMVQSKSE